MLRLRTSALFAAVFAALPALACADSGNTFAQLEFRNIGPTTGRIDAVAGVPGNSVTLFAGGLGGLWRTADGGTKWEPVFDKKQVTSIGAIAVAPSNPKIIYIGTGEPNMRNDVAFGDGVWRSNDGGSTWTHLGLDATAAIAQISIDARNPDIAYVAAVGDPFKPSADRGLYKTVDGGKTWVKSLYVNDTTGASTIAISLKNRNLVYAGMWTVQRRPWMLTSGGPDDGVYRSNDAGAHWTRVQGNGFPSGLTGRIGLRFAPSEPNILYALIESSAGTFWTSKDAGTHWTLTSAKHEIAQRPYYFSQFTVDPKNAKHIFFMTIVEMPSESFDGGKTVKSVPTGAYDHHQMWIDPVGGKRAIIGADAGVRLSQDGGRTWRDPQLIVSQPYHISVDDRVPYTVCGEFQDPGAVCGPELSFTGSITPDQWFSAQSGESGWIVFSPANDNVIYGTGYQEAALRFDRQAMQGRLISPWPDDYSGIGADAYKYRGAWVAPVAVSPLEPNALYFGTQYLMKTEDGGGTWNAVSPDLTRNDKSKQKASGEPITRDNAGTEVYDTIASIAESPITKGELWAGTDDGLVWVSRDGGAHWNNVTAGIPNLPHWARINNVDPSPYDDGTAYVVAENHKLGDRTPYLYVTRDFGAHWQSISGNLPRDSYARMLREDPVRKGMLYAGTETGLWLSFDDGAHWQTFFNNLPHAPVYDFVVQKRFDDLVVALHGRGVWILDDISPLQQWSGSVANSAAYLFPVRDAYRFNASWSTWATNEGGGDNPQDPAVINFYLQKAPPRKAKLQLQVFDGTQLVRTIDVDHPVQGMNRAWWDLTYDTVKLVPDYNAMGSGLQGLQVVPGTYTVRLSYNGATSERSIKVLPDPKTPGTQADMQAGFALAMQLRDDFRRVGNDIVALRSLDASLQRITPRVSSHTDAAHAVATLHSSVDAMLGSLYIRNAQNSEDTLRIPPRLYERIANAENGVTGSDYAPTAGQAGLAKELHDTAQAQFAADDELLGAKLNALNAALKSAGIPAITVKRS
ncbi:MAG: hypothetical protein JO322_02905 [Candidatus Eremiobacteraeota bacterium]|nr:hypothetical protein [Candidatus Eremiobacteraeota bacterium]